MTVSDVTPLSAVYVYSWDLENGKPPMKLYRVTGGKFNGSDVGAERLIELGIPIPSDTKGC